MVGFLFCLFFTIPAIYLHIEYSIANFGDKLEIDEEWIKVIRKGIVKKYNRSNLSRIIIYKSASLDKWGIPFSQMEYYRFARIITTNGEEIIITCLLCLNIDEELQKFSDVPTERRKFFFCSTFWK